MIVIADASVIISLASIGHLELLNTRFPEGVYIPSAVWKEVVDEGKGRPGAEEVRSAKWLTVKEVKDKGLIQYLKHELDSGEAEAIALAREECASVLLIDEREAREAANGFGIKVLGTIGLLVWAKQNNQIISLKSGLDRLQFERTFRISSDLYHRALKQVGE